MSVVRVMIWRMSALGLAVTQPLASPDPRRNGIIARQLMRQAVAQGARLVVFPEGHLSGYAKAQVRDWADLDWAVVREELELTADLAGELGIWTVIGSAHLLTPPRRPHNSMYVVSDQGQLVDRYDKRFCSHTEVTQYYTPGSSPVVFDGRRLPIRHRDLL